jgi:hypothetical protein
MGVFLLLDTIMGVPKLLTCDVQTTTLDVSVPLTVMDESELSIGIPIVQSTGVSSMIES